MHKKGEVADPGPFLWLCSDLDTGVLDDIFMIQTEHRDPDIEGGTNNFVWAGTGSVTETLSKSKKTRTKASFLREYFRQWTGPGPYDLSKRKNPNPKTFQIATESFPKSAIFHEFHKSILINKIESFCFNILYLYF